MNGTATRPPGEEYGWRRNAETLAMAQRVREQAAEAKAEIRGDTPRKGRPKEPGSARDLDERTGISSRQRDRIEKHVEVAEQYPFMQREGDKRHG